MALLKPPLLVADIGATNARFGLIAPDGSWRTRIAPCADHVGPAAAAAAFLDWAAPPVPPRQGVWAVAAAVTGDTIAMINHPWGFSVRQTRQTLALERLHVVNDFVALAVALPALPAADRRQIGHGAAAERAPLGVLGPGSGLGMAGLLPNGGDWLPLAGEGGHATLAAADPREAAVIEYWRQRLGHVSAESLLSGPGLVRLVEALAVLEDGAPATGDASAITAAAVTAAALDGSSALCRDAVLMFCALLGSVAGNLALTLGARGGIYLGGGILPRFGPLFDHSGFRERFEAKGRLASFMAAIPTWLITHPLPAFLGLQALDRRPVPGLGEIAEA
ncbi:MAG: glucokinase [Azospirillum sp.]|nr:glucokinase [Azospirillum sp.]